MHFLLLVIQADYLIALNDPEVMVHAMSRESAARITLRTVEALDHFASEIPPMAYDVRHFLQLGILSELLDISDPDLPATDDVKKARAAILKGIRFAKAEKLPERASACATASSIRNGSRAYESRLVLIPSGFLRLPLAGKKETTMTMILSAVVILAMCWALVKKYETRLVLIAGGLILACMAGDPACTPRVLLEVDEAGECL